MAIKAFQVMAAVLCVMLFAGASVEATRELQATISGCRTYRTIAGGRRVCSACTGGLIPGPMGDRCIRSSTTVSGPGIGLGPTISGCTSYRTIGGGRRVCAACSGGLIPGPAGDRCIRTSTTVGRPFGH